MSGDLDGRKTLPEDAIVEILCRTPVKSLVRFKCVCKPWLALISHPKFIEMHLKRASQDPNSSLIFHGFTHNLSHRLVTLFRLGSDPVNLFELDGKRSVQVRPPLIRNMDVFSDFFKEMSLVGSVNGIVCLYCHGNVIVLWNPAIKQFKRIPLPSKEISKYNVMVTMGLGFDSVTNDYKVVRIVPTYISKDTMKSRIAIFSNDVGKWKDAKGGYITFLPRFPNCNLIVKGTPYWVGVSKEGDLEDVLGTVDPHTGMYRAIRFPANIKNGEGSTRVTPVSLMDSVSALVYSAGLQEPNQMIDVYTLDESSGTWAKKYSTGPIPLNVLRMPQCFTNSGVILIEGTTDETEADLDALQEIRCTFLFDPKTNCILDSASTCMEAFKPLWYESYGHVESMVHIKGMEPLGADSMSKKTHKPQRKNNSKPTRKNRDKLLPRGFALVLQIN